MRHGLQHKTDARVARPGSCLDDGGDQLAAHAENGDILGGVGLYAVKPGGADGRDAITKPRRGNIALGILHGAAVNIRRDGTRTNAVPARIYRQMRVIRAYVREHLAPTQIRDRACQSLIKFLFSFHDVKLWGLQGGRAMHALTIQVPRRSDLRSPAGAHSAPLRTVIDFPQPLCPAYLSCR